MDKPEDVASHLARNLISLRHARALTQGALASVADLPRSTIANLESGEGNPSLAVLLKVAAALGTPIEELLSPPTAKVRQWKAADIASQVKGQGITIRPLVPEHTREEMLEVMELASGASMRGTPHLPGTREYFTCLEGAVTIFVAGERFDLSAGDVLAFPGSVPHSYRNPDGKRAALGVSVVILATRGS